VRSLVLAALFLFAGVNAWRSGYRVLANWDAVSPAYAGCAVLWMIAGTAMLVAGVWLLASRGRHSAPLRIGGAAAVMAGAVLAAGVLTHVVPCLGGT
jgi:hypothetical protein